jgi:hypothetical protein
MNKKKQYEKKEMNNEARKTSIKEIIERNIPVMYNLGVL